MRIQDLPTGPAPLPTPLPHFPDRLHAYTWRNWALAPMERLARVVHASPEEIRQMGQSMGLREGPPPTADQQRRSYITLIRRNWSLLPYEQLLDLLEWTPEKLAYTLREDDFLFIKLGSLKPHCESLEYRPPAEEARKRATEIAEVLRQEFPGGLPTVQDAPFSFVRELSVAPASRAKQPPSVFSPRFCYSYFALYGDPLLDKEADPYPDGYLARLARSGVDGVWLQGLLQKLAPFPWAPDLSQQHEDRLKNLAALVMRARRHGISIYLYLNEPRSMPLSFFEAHANLKGATEGDHAALCTSHPEVQEYIKGAIASICRAVPGLAGFFTITASENLTNCWSHGAGAGCPRCSKRTGAEVIAEVTTLVQEGIRRGGSQAKLLSWDWGWPDDWCENIIQRLPPEATLMSTSEWGVPINRGGVESTVGEYSISAVGPAPRALGHWEIARKRGLKTAAKIQAGNTWELSSVPYIPAMENVARHASNLRKAGVDGLMLGWTLGGYPSPNLEVVMEIGRAGEGAVPSPNEAMQRVAHRRFGSFAENLVVRAWKEISAAFSEFPFHIGVVYTAPLQMGPANLFWGQPTGYHATMVGIPYDDLDAWRAIYPPDVFIGQLQKVAAGFRSALSLLNMAREHTAGSHLEAMDGECAVVEAAAIHFASAANAARFVQARAAMFAAKSGVAASSAAAELGTILKEEIILARRLYTLQAHDSRIGFEASNHYFYTPQDLAEKVINCRYLLDHWLPAGGKERETGR